MKLKFCFSLLGFKTRQVPKVCHILITITRRRLFSRFSALLISCPVAFIIGQLSAARVVGRAGAEGGTRSRHSGTTLLKTATDGRHHPDGGEVERRGPFLPLPLFAPTIISSEWDQERAFLFRFRLFQMYCCGAASLRFQLAIAHEPHFVITSAGFAFTFLLTPRLSRHEL